MNSHGTVNPTGCGLQALRAAVSCPFFSSPFGRQGLKPMGLGLTWRFMGSYKWGYKSPNIWVIILATLLINPTYNYPRTSK